MAALFRLAAPNVSDPDSFYHFRHAAIYAEKGLTYARFPWLVYSAVSRFSADLAYGFHVLLIPFTLLRNEILGIKLAAILETLIVLVLMYLVMRRHRIACSGVWPFVLFLLGPPMTYTFLQTRPQTLTMGFSALLLSFMVRGSAWGVLVAAFGICFFHLNVFVVVPAVVLVAALVRGCTSRTWEWRKWVAALAGMVLGLALRPNLIGAAKLEYVQFVVHEMVRGARIPLLFGREWFPLNLVDATTAFTWFLLAWVGMAALALVTRCARGAGKSAEDRALLWSSLALSVLFFAVMIHTTKRATPLWATFGVIFVAVACSQFLWGRSVERERLLSAETRLVAGCLLAALLMVMAGGVVNDHLIHEKWVGRSSYRMWGAGQWLKENARPNDIVYNVSWGTFPELFFWDPQNRYVSGLDPIFLFAYDKALYWKTHHLQSGTATSQTWPSMYMKPEEAEDTYTMVKRDLRASHVVLEPSRREKLEEYLESDSRFERTYDDGEVVVFAVR